MVERMEDVVVALVFLVETQFDCSRSGEKEETEEPASLAYSLTKEHGKRSLMRVLESAPDIVFSRHLTKRAIHVPAMADIVDDNRVRLRINFIHDAVIADSKTIEMFRALQF